MKHLAILISVIILKSCGSSQDVASVANTTDMSTNEIISGTYALEQINGNKVTKDLTLEFDSKTNKVSGFTGCNRFFGTYTTSDNTISFSEIGATRRMCEDEINTLEISMLKALAESNSYELSEGKLSLKNNNQVLIVANETIQSKSRQSNSSINLTYRASTRGFFEMIWIEGHTFKYTNDRNLEEIHRFQMTDEQFAELLTLYKDIDLESLPTLEPPSKTFQYDAAAMATLQITEDEQKYKTNGFDHGNPPKSIAKLLMKVLYLKETMSKQ